MTLPHPLRRICVLCSFALLALFAGAACLRHDDCGLFDRCSDSLMDHARALAGSMADECESCLDQCQTDLSECNASKKCVYGTQCMLTHSARDFQHCLYNFYKNGFTRGDEQRRPWEGEETKFGRCLMKTCRSVCIEAPFVCDEEPLDYARPTLRVAVRRYPNYEYVTGATLRACGPKKCSESHVTNDAGVAVVDDIPIGIPEDGLYFEVEPIEQARGRPAIPFTRYYPSRLGSDDDQLVAVYLVTSDEIGLGNALLHRPGPGVVLEDAGQSLILPDSCVWDDTSAKGMRIVVEGVPQCHQLGREPCDDAGVCTPCVWYSREKQPTLTSQLTDGTGGGVVGLADGLYTIRVEQEDGSFVARRTLLMEAGTMTIARTWPQRE